MRLQSFEGDSFEGRIFTFDVATGILVIEVSGTSSKALCPLDLCHFLCSNRYHGLQCESSGPRSSTESGKKTFRIFKTKFLKSLQKIASPVNAFMTPEDLERIDVGGRLEPMRPVDLDALEQKERRAIEHEVHLASLQGRGVTAEAQDLFNRLYKMSAAHNDFTQFTTWFCTSFSNARWEGKSIVVGDVIIHEPYVRNSCVSRGGSRNESNVARVRNMVC